MKLLRLHGLGFILGVPFLIAGSFVTRRLADESQLIFFSTLILVLGVPHGAFDALMARQIFAIRGFVNWLKFVGIYLFLGLLVVGLWKFFPVVFLVSFLAVSIVHFSGDLAPETSLLTKIIYGGAIILGPNLYHQAEVTRLFSFLIQPSDAVLIVSRLNSIAALWMAVMVLFSFLEFRRNGLPALEMIAVSALVVITPPLFSFSLFFCCMHSARHVLKMATYLSQEPKVFVSLFFMVPLVAVFILGELTWHFLKQSGLDSGLIQLTFVGLAALNAPHMVLLESYRIQTKRSI